MKAPQRSTEALRTIVNGRNVYRQIDDSLLCALEADVAENVDRMIGMLIARIRESEKDRDQNAEKVALLGANPTSTLAAGEIARLHGELGRICWALGELTMETVEGHHNWERLVDAAKSERYEDRKLLRARSSTIDRLEKELAEAKRAHDATRQSLQLTIDAHRARPNTNDPFPARLEFFLARKLERARAGSHYTLESAFRSVLGWAKHLDPRSTEAPFLSTNDEDVRAAIEAHPFRK